MATLGLERNQIQLIYSRRLGGVSNKLEVNDNVYDALDEAKRKYYTYFQQTEDSNTKHVEAIKDLVATIEHYGGSVCDNAGLMKYERKKDGGARINEIYKKIVRAKTFGCVIIKQANADRYKMLLKDIRA